MRPADEHLLLTTLGWPMHIKRQVALRQIPERNGVTSTGLVYSYIPSTTACYRIAEYIMYQISSLAELD